MAVVVISSDGKGDRPVGSLEVKAPVGWEDRSDPYRGASNLTGRSVREPGSPEKRAPRETDRGIVGSAEPLRSRRRPVSTPQDWTHAMFELPGVIEDGMSGRNGQRKLGTARGSPRRSRTAKASRISRDTVKSRCAREWGGWGREVMTDRDNITRTRARRFLPPIIRFSSGRQVRRPANLMVEMPFPETWPPFVNLTLFVCAESVFG